MVSNDHIKYGGDLTGPTFVYMVFTYPQRKFCQTDIKSMYVSNNFFFQVVGLLCIIVPRKLYDDPS